MTETSRFWTGKTSTGALGDAGPYSAAQFAEFVSRIMDGGEKANRGVIKGVESDLNVQSSSPTAQSVRVASGAAVVQGRFYYNDGFQTVNVGANVSGDTRIDVIVLEADYTAQTIRATIVQGTPAAGYPSLVQNAGVLWQIPLAYLTLASGYATVTDSLITDQREYANIPENLAIDVNNDSAGVLETGSVAIWADANIDTTTSEYSRGVAGIVERRTLASGAGRVITQGIYPIICDETVNEGDYIVTSTTAGQGQGGGGQNAFAFVLTANNGAGTKALCYINVPITNRLPGARVYNSANISCSNGVSTLMTFNSERYDTDAMHSTSSNTGRLTCVVAGNYHIWGNIELASNGGDSLVFILLNGATVIARIHPGGLFTGGIVSCIYRLAVGDYVELYVQQNSGGAINVLSSSAYSPEFAAQYIGN